MYLPDLNHPGKITEKAFIDDFVAKKSFTLNEENKSYKRDTLKTSAKYNFINTLKVGSSNNALCIQYKADSANFNRSQISGVYCLASIDYRNSAVVKYFFLGIQPIIIDNRIVMDFVIAKPDGTKQRTYIYNIKKIKM